eukprot:scaffold17411_cov113-Isochrysis_galbana.AAC.6
MRPDCPHTPPPPPRPCSCAPRRTTLPCAGVGPGADSRRRVAPGARLAVDGVAHQVERRSLAPQHPQRAERGRLEPGVGSQARKHAHFQQQRASPGRALLLVRRAGKAAPQADEGTGEQRADAASRARVEGGQKALAEVGSQAEEPAVVPRNGEVLGAGHLASR